jgi:hypothetical protein
MSGVCDERCLYSLNMGFDNPERMRLKKRHMSTKEKGNNMSDRTIFRNSPTQPTITFFSKKSNKSIYLESYVEYCYALMLEADPNVISFDTQPYSIKYPLNGKIRRYTPDFHLIDKHGEKVVDTKDTRYPISEKKLLIYNSVRETFMDMGLDFKVIYVDMFSEYAKTLRSVVRFCSIDFNSLFEEVPTYKGRLKDIKPPISNLYDIMPKVFSGMSSGVIAFDKNAHLSPEMEVQW